jgi:hypothetical protein
LIQHESEAIAELESAFRAATDTRLRVFLLQVIWQHRHQSVIPLLAEALLDCEPQVWKESLDGLVTLASPASIDAMRSARTRQFTKPQEAEEFRLWLEEAIQQAERLPKGHKEEA